MATEFVRRSLRDDSSARPKPERCIPLTALVEAVEFGEEDNALLFIGIGASYDGNHGIRCAGIVGQMGNVGGDVEEVARLDDCVVFEALAVPDAGLAGEGVDGRFVGGVLVGAGAATGRDGDELHVDCLRSDRFSGDGYVVLKALLAGEGLAGMDEATGAKGCFRG